MRDFVINSTVNSSPNEKKTMAGFIGEKSGLVMKMGLVVKTPKMGHGSGRINTDGT
jgi:hypothetical protein